MRHNPYARVFALGWFMLFAGCNPDEVVSSQPVEPQPEPPLAYNQPSLEGGGWRHVRPNPVTRTDTLTTTYYFLQDQSGAVVGFSNETQPGRYWPRVLTSGPVAGSRDGRMAQVDVLYRVGGPTPTEVRISPEWDSFDLTVLPGHYRTFTRFYFDPQEDLSLEGTWTFLRQDPGLFWAYFTLFITEAGDGTFSGWYLQESHWRNRPDCRWHYKRLTGLRAGRNGHVSLIDSQGRVQSHVMIVTEDLQGVYLHRVGNELPWLYSRDTIPKRLPLDDEGPIDRTCQF